MKIKYWAGLFLLITSFTLWGCTSFGDKDIPSNLPSAVQKQSSDNLWNELKNTENFASHALEHIFLGALNQHNEVVGYHYEGLAMAKAYVKDGTRSVEDRHGVYTGQVFIDAKMKQGNHGYSSFFPKTWTAQEVVDAINEAYRSRYYLTGTLYGGKTKKGLEIQMYLDKSTKKIITAYPIYEHTKKKVKR